MLNKVKWICIVVMGGFALINNNTVTILVNEAEFGSVFSFCACFN